MVSQISIHTLHNAAPVQLRSVELHTLQGKRRGKEHTSLWALLKNVAEIDPKMVQKEPATHSLGWLDDIAGGFHTIDDWEGTVCHVKQTSLRGTEGIYCTWSNWETSFQTSVHLVCNFTWIMLPRHSCSPCWQSKTYLWLSYFSWKGEITTVYSDEPE